MSGSADREGYAPAGVSGLWPPLPQAVMVADLTSTLLDQVGLPELRRVLPGNISPRTGRWPRQAAFGEEILPSTASSPRATEAMAVV